MLIKTVRFEVVNGVTGKIVVTHVLESEIVNFLKMFNNEKFKIVEVDKKQFYANRNPNVEIDDGIDIKKVPSDYKRS